MDSGKKIDQIAALEHKLQSWAIRDVSDAARERYDGTIDQLVGVGASGSHLIAQKPETNGKSWIWSSAAIVVLGVTLWFVGHLQSLEVPSSGVAFTTSFKNEFYSDFTVIKSVNRVSAHEDDGLIIPSDGSTPHYRYRYHVVDEEQVRDEQTGTVITLRHPRQEVVTMPVTNF